VFRFVIDDGSTETRLARCVTGALIGEMSLIEIASFLVSCLCPPPDTYYI